MLAESWVRDSRVSLYATGGLTYFLILLRGVRLVTLDERPCVGNTGLERAIILKRGVQKYLTCKVKLKFTLEKSTRAQRPSRGITLLFP